MTDYEAVRVVALHALAAAAEEIGDDGWDNYPELGENDWERVGHLLKEIAAYPRPEEYREAYALLEARATTDQHVRGLQAHEEEKQ